MEFSALLSFEPQAYCVAQRMSWAPHRQTTREEDQAYCLLGLFNVYMPLVYGEGSKAFSRLQEEIMKISNDASIFIWSGHSSETCGMLARSPARFESPLRNDHKNCETIHRWNSVRENESHDVGFALLNSGMSMTIQIRPLFPFWYLATIGEVTSTQGKAASEMDTT